MNWDCYNTGNTKYDPGMPMVTRIRKRFMFMVEELGINKNMDELSNGQTVKEMLRCSASSCFDKYNICCKACDIKKCRYKCNFVDKEVCDHQYFG